MKSLIVLSTMMLLGINLARAETWDVTCRDRDCLHAGWTMETSLGDCAKYGGSSVWRGRNSVTVCKEFACYQAGWTIDIAD